MCQDENRRDENCCIASILKIIVTLQNRSEKFDCMTEGCDRPYLGPTPSTICFNTRPVSFYRCSDGGVWELPYTLNGDSGTSSVCRVENVEGCCATCRVLAPNPEATVESPYVGTDSFFTINLNCVGALKCLADTYIGCM